MDHLCTKYILPYQQQPNLLLTTRVNNPCYDVVPFPCLFVSLEKGSDCVIIRA